MYKFYVFFQREGAIISIFAYTFLFLDDFHNYKQSLTMMRYYSIFVLAYTLNHLWFIYINHPRQSFELLLFGVLATKTGYRILRELHKNITHKDTLYIVCSGVTCLSGILLTIFSIYKLITRYL